MSHSMTRTDGSASDSGKESRIDRRRFVQAVGTTAVVAGVSSTTGSARKASGTLSFEQVSGERATQAVEAALGASITQEVQSRIESADVSVNDGEAQVYQLGGGDGFGTMDDPRLVAVVPYSGGGWFSKEGMGSLVAVMTDSGSDMTVEATLGMSAVEAFNSFWDFLFGGDPDAADLEVHTARSGDISTQSVTTMEEQRSLSGDVDAAFFEDLLCQLCVILSEFICENFDVIIGDICGDIDDPFDVICQVLVEFIEEALCVNGDICNLIGC